MIMRSFNIFTAALIAGFTLIQMGFANAAMADNRVYRPNIIIMVQDDDPDTTPARNQRVMSRIVGGMGDVLNSHGYNIYDRTAITQEFVLPSDQRKARSSLVEMARTVKTPPLDAALLIKLYASAKKAPYNDIYRLDIRAEGDLLSVKTGQVIGHFETEAFDKPVLPVKCDRDCILENVGKNAKIIGNDLASAIEIKLAGFLNSAGVKAPRQAKKAADQGVRITVQNQPQIAAPAPAMAGAAKPACTGFPMGYTMTFLSFDDREKRAIEEFLNAFSCVQNIRMLDSSPEKLAFWYEISANDAVLHRNLRTMLDYMNVKGQVNISGSKIQVQKVLSR
jgi:hypothetical protein